MKKLIIVFIIMLFASPVLAEDLKELTWNKTDKLLMSSFVIGQTINYAQTNYIYHHENWIELNPVMNTLTGHGEYLLEYKVLSTIGIGAAAHYLPQYRRKILAISNIIVFGFAAHDAYVSVRFQW